MRVDRPSSAGGGYAMAATGDIQVPGRNQVEDRVYRTVTEVASAAVIGVPRSALKVDVAEYGDGLAVRIAGPLPIPNLEDTVAIAASGQILERARLLQETLREQLAGILGRDITRVNLTITGATIPQRRRVQ